MSNNYAKYRELANEAFNEGCMEDALECLKVAYELAILEFGKDELAADYAAIGRMFSWSAYNDDAFYYYKTAYDFTVA